MKKVIWMFFIVVIASFSASAQIFNYQLQKSSGYENGPFSNWKFYAYIIHDGAKLYVYQYNSKYKEYEVYEVVGAFDYKGGNFVGFAAIGLGGYENAIDIGNGKYLLNPDQSFKSIAIKGARVDYDYFEHGQFKVMKNKALTRLAYLYYYYYEWTEQEFIEFYLQSKGYVRVN